MKIFLSWSGNRSQAVAEEFNGWLKCVIQAAQPWISTKDIDRGAIWFSEINEILKDVSIGVVFLTQENKNKPWILFETGALTKGLPDNRVCTFLIDLKPEDLEAPLSQFNHTTQNKDSVFKLLKTINSLLDESKLPDDILAKAFETYWPQFEEGFSRALSNNQPNEVVPARTDKDMLAEILNNTRILAHQVRELESNSREISANIRYPRQINRTDILMRMKTKINEMIKAGIFNEEEIISSLDRSDFPEDYIRLQIRYALQHFMPPNAFPSPE